MKIFKKSALLATLLISIGSNFSVAGEASAFYPAVVLKMDPFFTHHVLVAEKSTHLLHLYAYSDNGPELVKSFPMATGKMTGDKKIEGDFKTPEGIYHFTNFMNHAQLIKENGKMAEIYGAGAFVMNYPNPMDQKFKKTGSGIWLHSTNDETRIDKGLDSRGCVVTANNELMDVSKYIELNKTPIVVVQELEFLNAKTFNTHKTKLETIVQDWLNAWKNKDLDKYISFYHPIEFSDKNRNYNAFKTYKKAIFANPGKPEIELDHLSILANEKYAVVTFTQNYKFNRIDDIGKKILYLARDENYNWKITNENWTKQGLENLEKKIAFTPSLRFFNAKTKEGIEMPSTPSEN